MRLTHAIMACVAALVLTACSTIELPEVEANGIVEEGDSITLTVSLDVPTMAEMPSRAMGEKPDYGGLHLYLLEFERNSENPLENFLLRSYEAEEETPAASPAPEHVNFKVTLNKTSVGRVLHLVAVPKGVTIDVKEPLSEGSIIPTLTTTDGREAYWQRLDFPDGYGRQNGELWETHPEVKEKLTMVPMVRNFASVKVTNSASNFTLDGFFLTNTASAGTVAPWNQAQSNFPTYLDAGNGQLDYQTLSQAYKGLLPAAATLDDVAANYTDDRFQTSPLYIYELPFNSAKPAQLLIKGRYGSRYATPTYYKIDLGHMNREAKIFEQYNLLRNIAYTFNITSASAPGYATIDDAIAGAVYNNLSFDVSTQRMLNISDGENMLQVSFTTAVVTENTPAARTLRFGYRYRKGIANANPVTANDEISFANLESGTAIASVTAFGATDADGWRWCTITTKAPTMETRTQSFRLIDDAYKLARTINIVVREPWEIARNVVYAGTYNQPEQFPYDHLERRGKVGTGVGAELTVFFSIPENLPQAIFPLQFVLESDLQNIENNPIGSLYVTSGPSFFDGENQNDYRIKYVKTVSWTDYHTLLDKDHPTGTIVMLPEDKITPGGPNHVHRIRARMRTLTANESGQTTIRIHNPYFHLGTPDATDTSAPTVGTKGGVVEVKFSRDDNLNLDGTAK